MGLFKGLDEKPYTKADYYNELEARHAAKIAAKAAPVVVVPVKDPEWLEPEEKKEILKELVEEEIVVPFVEPLVVSPIIEEKQSELTINNLEKKEEPLKKEKVPKQKRKKTG